MSNWKSMLKADLIAWLLESDNPSVKYFTLIDILEKPRKDTNVRKAKKQIMETGVVSKILTMQKNGGYWGKHTCHMGVVKALKALAEIPINKRSVDVKNTIEKGAEYMLKHHIHKKSHDLSQVSKPKWLQFGFPLMWNTDVLEILGILTRLGYKDERMKEAIDLVVSKQDEQGRWILENTYNGRFLVNIERKGKWSKWVTLNALRVLKRTYR